VTAAGDLHQVAGNVERFLDDAVKRAVADLKRPILAQARRDTGGDLRLSRLGRARLGVQTKVTGTVNVIGTVTAGPRKMRGPWRWLNDGTRRRPQGRGQHPGTPAKGTWDRPAIKAIPQVERDIAARFNGLVN
jgi:hypothetical protein